MALSFDTNASNQISSGVYGVHWLIDLGFSTPIYVTTAPINVSSNGNTYIGVGELLSVSTFSESEDNSAERITVSWPITDDAMIAATIGDTSTYRGKNITFYLQLFDEKMVPVGARVKRWKGVMEPVSVKPKKNSDGTTGGRIEMPCTRIGVNFMRKYQGVRHTHVQHQLRFPGDMGLQYLESIINKPALWLSKKFQEV